MLRINGAESCSQGLTVEAYLTRNGYRTDRVAVELNGAIVSRQAYAATTLGDGDSVEIVQFVGGG